jgi:hypothetical membrane protein
MITTRFAGFLLFLGILQFILLMKISEFIYPNYSVAKNFISDLGSFKANTFIIFNSSVIILGILAAVAGYILYLNTKKIFSIVLIIAGIGGIGVGAFPEEMGILHSLFSLIAFLFGSIAAILGFTIAKSYLKIFSPILGLTSLISLILFILRIDLGLGIGGIERMIVYPFLLWGLAFSGYLMKE